MNDRSTVCVFHSLENILYSIKIDAIGMNEKKIVCKKYYFPPVTICLISNLLVINSKKSKKIKI